MCSDSSCISLTGMFITIVTAYLVASLPYRLQILGGKGTNKT